MKKKKAKYSIFLFFYSILFFSCNSDSVIYDQYQKIENTQWKKGQEYYFSFLIEDNSVPYDLYIDTRNNNLYPYKNLWILYKEERPIGAEQTDMIECFIADNSGKWTGAGFSIYHNRLPVKMNHSFPYKGRYIVSLTHGMQTDYLEGIMEIGLFVKKSP
jgi:gliding motility-associated lipoprotein GldH